MPSSLLAKVRIYVLLLQFSVLALLMTDHPVYLTVSYVVAFRGTFLLVACFHLGACCSGPLLGSMFVHGAMERVAVFVVMRVVTFGLHVV